MIQRLKFHNLAVGLFIVAVPIFSAADDNPPVPLQLGGIGFAMSSDGQSVFYARTWRPLAANQPYYSVGIHIEGDGLGAAYDPSTGRRVVTAGRQRVYTELGLGLRRLLFRDAFAGGFAPILSAEAGATGYFKKFGSFDKRFNDAAMRWAPYVQVGAGVSVRQRGSLFLFELGFLSSLELSKGSTFPPYDGYYLKVLVSWGKGVRSR